ncbi:alpha-1,2-fucosyltransferase [Thioclava sp. BHET1]|nr:alpha-1,2-fucosyltransferase [Thioclava sp. BHET1]
MIITRLRGGFGAQMFQYAAARSMAARLDVEVALDDRYLVQRGLPVAAPHFNWQLSPPDHLPPQHKATPVRYMLWRSLGLRPHLRRERGLGYNPSILHWGDGSYLSGLWQSERYFQDIASTIRSEMRIVTPPGPDVARWAERISAGPSVSLYLRRRELEHQQHPVCSAAYFQVAVARLMRERGDAPRVYVFADDPGWAEHRLHLDADVAFVELSGETRQIDMLRLMRMCESNIISNNAFSWWGAWLNDHSRKTVIGPMTWFGRKAHHNPDILPTEWLAVA